MLIGQRQAETILARALAADRVAHAYLFLGAGGAGKSTGARLFAKAINCSRQPAVQAPGDGSPSPTLVPIPFLRLAPCGECESCRRIAVGTHPEVAEVLPDSKTGQNIGIPQAREIRLNAALRPKLGKRRVYIFPNAEALSEPAANCLLKTLEEPSDFVTLILCAPNPVQVLPTIRSRCQTVRFGLAPPAEIAEALEERGIEPERALALARASGGRPGLAISWTRDPAVLEQRTRVLDLFAQAVALQRQSAQQPFVGGVSLRLSEKLCALVGKRKEEKGEEDGPARPAKVQHSENLEIGLTYLRDLLLLAEGASVDLVQNQDRLPEFEKMAAGLHPSRVVEDLRVVRESQQLLDRNVQPQLVLERMFWSVIAGRIPLPEPLFQESLA